MDRDHIPEMAVSDQTWRQALVGLLCDSFSRDELARWIALHHGPRLAGEIVGDSLAALASNYVLAVDRRGLLTRAVFDELGRQRPRFAGLFAAIYEEMARAAVRDASGDDAVTEPTRPVLRRKLRAGLATDSDLEAFVGDHFPDIAWRWTAGMDRVQKTTILLTHVDLPSLDRALRAEIKTKRRPT